MLDIISPLNESRDKILILETKYLVDPAEHYYLVHLQLVIAIAAGCVICVGVDPFFLATIHHFIGLINVIK